MTTRTLLLTVTESFAVRGRGVVVSPDLPLAEATRAPFTVLVRRPDGAEREAEATIEVAHAGGTAPRAWGALFLRGLEPGDVPAGTEIWREA